MTQANESTSCSRVRPRRADRGAVDAAASDAASTWRRCRAGRCASPSTRRGARRSSGATWCRRRSPASSCASSSRRAIASTEGAVLARLVPADAPLLDPRARAEQEARLHASEAAVAQANANVARARVADGSARDDLTRKQQARRARSAISRARSRGGRERRGRRARRIWRRRSSAPRSPTTSSPRRSAALQRGRSGPRRRVRDRRADLGPGAARAARERGRGHRRHRARRGRRSERARGRRRAAHRRGGARASGHGRVHRSLGRRRGRWRRACAASSRRASPRCRRSASRSSACACSLDLTAPPDEWRALGDNFRVEVHIVAWQADSVLRAPTRGAVPPRRRAGRAFVVEDGRARARTLQIGEQSPTSAEVRGGARAGETVILRPGESLRDGARVAALRAN